MACGKLINIRDDGYDPRGSGTDYYIGECDICGKKFKYSTSTSEQRARAREEEEVLPKYCGKPEKVRERAIQDIEDNIRKLQDKLKEYQQ